MTIESKSAARKSLERITGPLSFGALLTAVREGEGWSQTDMAVRLGVSRSHLCDLEKGRKSVSPARAAAFAAILGYSEKQFVRLVLQDLVNQAGLKFEVRVA